MQSLKPGTSTSSQTSFKKICGANLGCISESISKTNDSSLNDEPSDFEKYDEETNECYFLIL